MTLFLHRYIGLTFLRTLSVFSFRLKFTQGSNYRISNYSSSTMANVVVLYDGYSTLSSQDEMLANCSCTLITGKHNIIIDTMTAWDKDKIIYALQKQNVSPDDISFVISTHGHSDHIGNNNLFLKAKHIVGFSVSYENKYYLHPFDKGEEYIINEHVKIIPTPGHTLSDVTVIATTNEGEKIAVAGDLFEKEEDIENKSIWLEAGSEDPSQQINNRLKIAQIADWIIPGHGRKFKVTEVMRQTLQKQVEI